jgi:hypothetical protein
MFSNLDRTIIGFVFHPYPLRGIYDTVVDLPKLAHDAFPVPPLLICTSDISSAEPG